MGRTHAIACMVTATGAGGLIYFNKLANLITSCNISIGALLGILISPDLDLMETGNYSMVILGKASHFLAKIWRLFWWPYAKLSHHRGFSHWPIIGTILRVAYMILWSWIIMLIISPLGLRWTLNYSVLMPIVLGLVLSDFVHTLLDVIF
jgi:uncharacterized metal-binding protein